MSSETLRSCFESDYARCLKIIIRCRQYSQQLCCTHLHLYNAAFDILLTFTTGCGKVRNSSCPGGMQTFVRKKGKEKIRCSSRIFIPVQTGPSKMLLAWCSLFPLVMTFANLASEVKPCETFHIPCWFYAKGLEEKRRSNWIYLWTNHVDLN